MFRIILFISVLFFASCQTERKTTTKEHINLIITPDLSNRIEKIYPKPVSDISLIKNIYSSYYPEIYNIKNRVLGQKDVIQFRFTNPAIINKFSVNLNNLKMDLSEMSASDRIDFLINGGSKGVLRSLNTELRDLYANAREHSTGGDIYNYFKKEISPVIVKETQPPKAFDETTIINLERNIIVLFTDGYLEAGLYGDENCFEKQCLFLSKEKVDQFRRAFLSSRNKSLEDFFLKSGYGIIPIENASLKNTEVFVAEMYDRSLNKNTGSQTVSPNDFEILTLFWSDWLEKSGVKRYKLLDISNSKEEFLSELKTFIKEG
jgi:hypothetical protein